jgi:hypothetical protein
LMKLFSIKDPTERLEAIPQLLAKTKRQHRERCRVLETQARRCRRLFSITCLGDFHPVLADVFPILAMR